MQDLLKQTGYSIARGIPQAATGFVDLAALPFTMSGLLEPEDVFGSTDYLTKKGLLPKPEQGLFPETTELVSSLISPAGATKAAILGTTGLLADAALTSGALQRLGPPVGSMANPKGLLSNEFNLEKRFARAKEQGFDTDNIMYHGSTFDIKEFGGQPNPESAFGSGYYFTSNPEDASINYAGEGPDLTNRIVRRAEELESDEIPFDEAKKIAKEELKGTADEVVYPVVLRTKNSFDIRKNGTNPFLDADYPDPFEQDRDYYLKQTDGDIDEARELAEEARFDFEPEGAFVDFYQSVMNNPAMDNRDQEKFASFFGDYLYEGISAKDLDKQFNKLEIYPESENGELIKSEVFRQALEDAGFDSVKHDADRFPNMEAVEGTEHTIIFDAENIRSTQAEFDPKKQKEKDILSFNQGLLGVA